MEKKNMVNHPLEPEIPPPQKLVATDGRQLGSNSVPIKEPKNTKMDDDQMGKLERIDLTDSPSDSVTCVTAAERENSRDHSSRRSMQRAQY